jgi:hypothetical protein
MTDQEIIKFKSEKQLNSISLAETVLKMHQILISIAKKEVEGMSKKEKKEFKVPEKED